MAWKRSAVQVCVAPRWCHLGLWRSQAACFPRTEEAGVRISLAPPNHPALHAVLVSMSSSLRGWPVPASAVRAETGEMLGRLKRLVELQARVTAAIAEEEDFLHGNIGSLSGR